MSSRNTIKIGEVVRYTLTQDDVRAIELQASRTQQVLGLSAHEALTACAEGLECPGMVTAVEMQEDVVVVALSVFPPGHDLYRLPQVQPGEENGTYRR